jgi:RNA polymerase sigma-70 factor (ECF subfamily)
VSEKTNRQARTAGDTGEVIGAEFTGVLHAAQQGRVSAFLRLWSDIQPALTRYLRVVAVADADDIATESWVAVVRRVRAFEGDEVAWRAMVFAAARMHAEDENQRRVWDAMVEDEGVTSVVAAPLPAGEEPFEEDELEGGPAHGLRMAIEAIRDLPPEQGEVLMLRRMAGLPEDVVADLAGTEPAVVHTLEQEALDRLGLDAELLAWALDAEPRPVELADESVVVSVYRAAVPEVAPSPSVVVEDRSVGGARVIALRSPTWRTRAGAAAAASAAVLGMGALSAAAYQGVLPDPVQNVMHVVIGAPEATPEASTSSAAPTPKPPSAAGTRTTVAPGASSAGPAEAPVSTRPAVVLPKGEVVALCRSWEKEREHPATRGKSAAYRSLEKKAGGAAFVDPFCRNSGVPLAPLDQAATTKPIDKPTNPTPKVTKDKSDPKPEKTKTPPGKPPQTSKPPDVPSSSTTTTTTEPPPTTTTTSPPATGGSGGSSEGGGSGAGAGRATENPGAAKAQEQGAG